MSDLEFKKEFDIRIKNIIIPKYIDNLREKARIHLHFASLLEELVEEDTDPFEIFRLMEKGLKYI